MGGSIIAIGLLVTVAVTIHHLYRCRREPTFGRHLVIGIIGAALFYSVFLGIALVNGHEAYLRIWLITSCCFMLALCVGSSSVRLYLFSLCFTFIAMIALCWGAGVLLHNRAYTSHKSAQVLYSDSLHFNLEIDARTKTKSYPAGWLIWPS